MPSVDRLMVPFSDGPLPDRDAAIYFTPCCCLRDIGNLTRTSVFIHLTMPSPSTLSHPREGTFVSLFFSCPFFPESEFICSFPKQPSFSQSTPSLESLNLLLHKINALDILNNKFVPQPLLHEFFPPTGPLSTPMGSAPEMVFLESSRINFLPMAELFPFS